MKVSYGICWVDKQNADSATFRSDADYSKFLYVEVDGNKLSKDDYGSHSGSTVIVLKRAFIKKLGLGSIP